MMIRIPAPDFDLEKTLNSGQVFHWQRDAEWFYGLIGDVPVRARQQAQVLIVEGAVCNTAGGPNGGGSLPDRISRYFALDHQLGDICESFPKDPVMTAAVDYCRGLRIIRQPKWECLATFICSSMKQVAHIRQMSHALRERFGEPRKIREHIVHTFPTATRLSQSSEHELRQCSLGYRAKNLFATAQKVSSGEVDLEAGSALSDEALTTQLCRLPGVGPKVASCVMLFAYERLKAFPIDVWIERVLREQYFARKRKPTAAKLRAFSATYFGEHGGYAQQYLFHHARTGSRKS